MAEIRIQVCYARNDFSWLRAVDVPDGSTVLSAIQRSGVLDAAPEIDLAVCRVGVFGKLKPLDAVLRERDRVEIYRPLIADPKESRRERAEKKTPGTKR